MNTETTAHSSSPGFIGRVLVVSNDAVAISQLGESMQRLALSPEQCPDVVDALDRLKRAKFEAVIVDFRLGSEVGTVLEEAHRSASNRHAVVLAISDGEIEAAEAFRAGSTFVIRRPLSVASIDSGLRAAYGLIVRERRRYFRSPVEASVAIVRIGMPTVRGQSINVSEGGMLIDTVALLQPEDEVQLQFSLPGVDFQFALDSAVCWAKDRRLGLRFRSPKQTHKLQEWLARRLEEDMPQSVRDKFSSLPPD